MDSSKATNTGFIDQLGQQQEPKRASSEEASTSINDKFQQLLNDPVLNMPLFPDSFGQDFSNANSLAQLPVEGQATLDGNFGIDFMTEDFFWTNQNSSTTWEAVSQQAEVQPSANIPWPSAPFGVNQSGLHFAHQEIPEAPRTAEILFHYINTQFSANQLVGCGPCEQYTPATAGADIPVPSPIGGPLPSFFESGPTGLSMGSSLHVQRGNRYHCLFQSCSRSFKRLPDLFRHQTAYHLQNTAFWCGQPGCERAGPYGRPFPRKDKRTEHERKAHGVEYAHLVGQ